MPAGLRSVRPPSHPLGRALQGRNLRYQWASCGASATRAASWPASKRWSALARWGRGRGRKRQGLAVERFYFPSSINILPPLPTLLSPRHLSGTILCSSSESQGPFLPSSLLPLPAPSPRVPNVTAPLTGSEPASPLIHRGELRAPSSRLRSPRPGLRAGQVLYDPSLPPCSQAPTGPGGSPPAGPVVRAGPHKHSATGPTPAAAWW